MPTFRGITVHVYTNSMQSPEETNKQLREWGEQHMGRSNTVSCYVQSDTGFRFQVTIQPQLPYTAENYQTRQGIDTRIGRPAANTRTSDQCPASFGLRISNLDRRNAVAGPVGATGSDLSGPANETGHSHSARPHGTWSKPSSSGRLESSHNTAVHPPPPFHLLATLYLDGRKIPERRVIVYLDHTHPEFRRPNGTTGLNTRWVEGRDGKLRKYYWLFNDVGIDTLLNRLVLSKESQHTSDPLDVDELSVAMIATNLTSEEDDSREEKLQLGQIVIEFQRVTVGQTYTNHHFHPRYREGDEEDINMTGLDQVSHMTGVGYPAEKNLSSIPVIHYYPYARGEGLYARFQFFYRRQEKLQKFNFPGFLSTMPSKPTTAGQFRTRESINSKIASMSHLGRGATTTADEQTMLPRSQGSEKKRSKPGLTKDLKDALDTADSSEWFLLAVKASRSNLSVESRKDSTTSSARSVSPASSDTSTIIVNTGRNKARQRGSSTTNSVSGIVSCTWDVSTTSGRRRSIKPSQPRSKTMASMYRDAPMDDSVEQDSEPEGSFKSNGERFILHNSGYDSEDTPIDIEDESSDPDIERVRGRSGKRSRSLDPGQGEENPVKVLRRASVSVTGIKSAREDMVKALDETDMARESGVLDSIFSRPKEERRLLLGQGGLIV